MSEVLTETKDITCPGCKANIKVEMAKPKHKVIIEENDTTVMQENRTHDHKHEEPKPDPHDEIARTLPKGVNFARCANGNCMNPKIKNAKGITTKYKACPNCKANTVPKSNEYCPTCGKEPEQEDWEDSEVELEIDEEE